MSAEETKEDAAAQSGGVPNPDSDGASYRWERRFSGHRYHYYVLRKGRGAKEKVIGKWRTSNHAADVVEALNKNSSMEVL